MGLLTLATKETKAAFYVDESADAGIRRVAGKVVEDFNRVSGHKETLHGMSCDERPEGEIAVFFGCYDCDFAEELTKAGKADFSVLAGKWEAYGYWVIEDAFPGVKKALVILGSDKRGAIYGAFGLSELMGVTPLSFWADAVIPKKDEIVLKLPDVWLSKEPSVQYRGFFINDEWPCFGNWTADHYDGFTAGMYDKVFELLLRLKGNYLWPAMWTSSFALDGPGTAAAELADLYGIFIGNSHHEPCLRASEEWDTVRGEDSIYGNAWNFAANREGLTNYWRDGLARSAKWESLVTVGMRGERDSKILGEDATLKDNIDLLKDTIHCQKKLIHEAEEAYNKKLPMMLALYKEVEPYYYGDENTEGLCEWDELQDITLMLCEDNFGYMRTLPDEKMRKHPAGFGMYYHFDYHGGPISYEWVNSTPLTKVWEQMCQAYDYGVRKVWIVNVGDLKFNEFPLSYFLRLAYDFESWGTAAPGREREYTLEALRGHFGGTLREEQVKEAEWILSEYVRQNGMRRPEALNPSIYHPSHFSEADRMLARADALEDRTKKFLAGLDSEQFDAAYSLFGFSALASANLLKLHLYAAKNKYHAERGRKLANEYADKLKFCIEEDKRLAAEFAAFKDGKWSGMERASHIGFTKWNEDGCMYPLRMLVEPVSHPRLQVADAEDTKVCDKIYGAPMRIVMENFRYEPEEEAYIELANTGTGSLHYTMDMPACEWLACDAPEGDVEDWVKVRFTCDRSKLTCAEEQASVMVSDGDTRVEIIFKAKKWNRKVPDMTFLPGKSGFVMNAEHYYAKSEPEGVTLTILEDYGIVGSAVKAYPSVKDFEQGKEPVLSYRMYSEKAGEYLCEIWFAPVSPLKRDGRLQYGLQVNDGETVYQNTVPEGYLSGESSCAVWSEGALTHRRRVMNQITLKEGINELHLYLADAGLVPERIFVYEKDKKPAASYLGPAESFYVYNMV